MKIEIDSASAVFVYEETNGSVVVRVTTQTTNRDMTLSYTMPRVLENVREVVISALQSYMEGNIDEALVKIAQVFVSAARRSKADISMAETLRGYYLSGSDIPGDIYVGRID